MDILVFKTGISEQNELMKYEPHLGSLTGIKRWSLDADDVDKVLRVESENLSPREIERTLINAGCYCEELPD